MMHIKLLISTKLVTNHKSIMKYIKTIQITYQGTVNGGIIYQLMNYLLKVFYLVPILLMWRALMNNGVEVGMTLEKMLTYTYLGGIFSYLLVVQTPASSWFYEGLFISLYQRPLNILGHLIAQTIGGWVSEILFFSLPMIILAPVLGVSLRITSIWFIPSLVLCIALGFAMDFLFVCLIIRLKNSSWLVTVIRIAIISLFSGSVIPFAVLPWGVGSFFQYLPFGSLAGAPLTIFTGLSEPFPIIIKQFAWNIILWPISILVFKKSQERMVSYGG